jgi:2,3-bisphosphoglycerate-independent phosphoglycerate mutase
VKNTLGEAISKAGLKQLRLAETDKFAHVTFFFNAQRQEPWPGEERILIESPKVPNFAMAPRMSADKLADELIRQLKAGTFDIIIANFANPDLVGHGGDLKAVITACETVDENLARVLPVLEEAGYDWIITADHGNAEEKYYPGTTTYCPSHSSNRVQTFVHSSAFPTAESLKKMTGLKDIAPMCLTIMGLPVPPEMRRS